MTPRTRIGAWLFAIAGPAIAVVIVLSTLLVVTGHDPSRALHAFWAGSVGSAYAFGSATMIRAIPLMLSGLAVAVAFRVGVWNIGAEGQILAGAAAATAVATAWGDQIGATALALALVAGALAGGSTA